MDSEKPIFVRVKDATHYFGLPKTNIYRLSRQGLLRIYKHGNMSWLKVAEVEAFIEGRNPEAA